MPNTNRDTGLVGPALALSAFALYVLTAAGGAYPGLFADLLTEHAGLSFKPPVLHPLWTFVVRAVKAIPIGAFAVRMNVLSALFGALSVWLMFLLTRDLPHDRASEERHSRVSSESAGLVSGLAAALFLATSIPFWMVSNRAHFLSLGVLWMLFVLRRIQLGWMEKTGRGQWTLALLTGLGASEYAGLVALTPAVFLSAFLLAAKTGGMNLRRHVRNDPWRTYIPWTGKWIGCYAIGLLPYLISALSVYFGRAHRWFAEPTLTGILRFALGSQVRALYEGIPRVGWFVVAAMTFGLVLIVLVPKKAERREQVLGSYFLHLVMTGSALAVLLDWKLSPWRMTHFNPLLVAPYVAVALAGGYLSGYWLRVLGNVRTLSFLRLTSRRPLVAPALILILGLALGVKNFTYGNARNVQPVHRYARSVAERLNDGEWLLSDGLMDSLIQLECHRQRKHVIVLNPRLQKQSPYLKYIASHFEEQRLKAMAEIGLTAFLDEWISRYDGEDKLVSLGNADLPMQYGFDIALDGPLCRSAEKGEVRADDQREWIGRFDAFDPADLRDAPIAGLWNGWVLDAISKQINNSGFLLHRDGELDAADAFYEQALFFNRFNVSALLNRLAVCRNDADADCTGLSDRLDEVAESEHMSRNVWHLSRHYGFVYDPAYFMDRGVAWAISGKPRMSAREFQRALQMGAGSDRIQALLLGLQMAEGDYAEGRRYLLQQLKEDPDNPNLALSLARMAMLDGDVETAEAQLNRLVELGRPASFVNIERGMMHLLTGEYDKARERLTDALEADPENQRLAAALTLLGIRVSDRKLIEQGTRALRGADEAASPERNLLLGRAAMAQKEWDLAREFLSQTIRAGGRRREEALQSLLAVETAERRRSEAMAVAERILLINSRNAYANYIMGTIHIAREQYALAESYLRAALESNRSGDVLNTLAYALIYLDREDDALPLAMEAVSLHPENGHYLDTLGLAQWKRGEIDTAIESFERSLRFMPGHPEVVFHLARALETAGQGQEALRLVDSLTDRLSLLPAPMVEELRQMRIRLL